MINYSFNITGSYFRVEVRVYKNSISQSNLIAYVPIEDESNYDPIVYPQGYNYKGYVYKSSNDPAFATASKYIIELKAWEYQGQGATPAATATLTYTPPVETPNLVLLSVEVYNNASGVKIFDSKTSSNAPQLKKNINYRFRARIRKTGNANLQNVRIDLCQYDSEKGTYPTVSPKAVKTEYVSLLPIHNDFNVDFDTTIVDFGSNLFMGIAFDIDKDNTVAETNENDNIWLLPAVYHQKTAIDRETIQVNVYYVNGNLLKKLETTSDDTNFMKVKSQLGTGKYILKTKELTKQVLIK